MNVDTVTVGDEFTGISETVVVKQQSPEWHALRLGKVTASRIADMLAKTKAGVWGAGRRNYMVELATERLTGVPRTDGYKSEHMIAGTEAEPEAISAYEFLRGVQIEECGFVPHPTIGMAGASPDGRVGKHGLVEIKCPILATHQETILGGTIPRQYELQRQWQLACTGCDWCEFISYLDTKRYPEREFDRRNMRLFVRRTTRNNAQIAEIEREVVDFLKEVDEHFRKLDRQFPRDGATVPFPTSTIMAG